MSVQLHNFIGSDQLATLAQAIKGEEGEFFKAKIKELTKLFETMPVTYEQDGKGNEAIVYLHYFCHDCDWYIIEKDKGDEEEEGNPQYQAFGLACIQCDELGYINLVDVLHIGAELDLHWEPKTLGEVKKERRGETDEDSQRKEYITVLMNSAIANNPEASNQQLKEHYAYLNKKNNP